MDRRMVTNPEWSIPLAARGTGHARRGDAGAVRRTDALIGLPGQPSPTAVLPARSARTSSSNIRVTSMPLALSNRGEIIWVGV